MNNLSNAQIHEIMAALLIVPTSKVNGMSFDLVAKALGELLAFREAAEKPVKRVNADQMHRVCLEATRHLDKYGVMAKEINKLLGRIPATPLPVVLDDVKRMDWLCSMTVEVREPMIYGSHHMFYSQCDSDDDEPHHTRLRAQIDSAMLKGGKS